VDEMKRRTRRG